MNIEDIKERVANFKEEWAGATGVFDREDFSDEVLYLISIIEEALKHSNGAPYESSFENKYRLLEVRNILQGDE